MANYISETKVLLGQGRNQVSSLVDAEVVMLSIRNERYYYFNEVASEIWLRIEKPCSFEEIVKHLTSLYDVSYDECFNKTKEFIDLLINQGVIELYNETS